MIGEALHRQQAAEILREQPEHLRVVQLAHHVHLALDVAVVRRHLAAQAGGELAPVGRLGHQARVEQLVEQDGMAREVLRGPARRREQLHHAAERLRLFGEQREVGGAAGDGLEEFQGAGDRGLRMRGRGGRLQHARQQQVEALAALRGQLLVAAAGAEALQPVEQRCRLGKAARLEDRAARGGVAGAQPHRPEVVTGGRDAAAVAVGAREHRVEMPRHLQAMHVEALAERRPVGVGHARRDARAVVVAGRQLVGLRVLQILQPMLHLAQEDVRLREFAHRDRLEQAALGEAREHLERGPHLQRTVAPAADQLVRLGDEFDFANAARTELHVLGEIAAHHFLADLRMQRTHRADGAVVEILAVHERPNQRRELAHGGIVAAADHAALDPRIALPLAALRDEVLLQRVEARDQRARVAPRPQAHVDAEHAAVGGRLVEQRDDAPADAGEVLVIGDAARPGQVAFLGIDEHEVDVGGDVELASAQLAHADHQQRLRARALRYAALGVEARMRVRLRRGDCRLREIGHRAGDFRERRHAGQIARQRAQQDAGAQFAQHPREGGFVGGRLAGEERAHLRGGPCARARFEFGCEGGAGGDGAGRVPRPFLRLGEGHNSLSLKLNDTCPRRHG